MTNVIQFPKNNTNPQSLELNSPDVINSVRQQFCDEVVSDVLDAVSGIFTTYGIISKGSVDSIKDIVFLEEALKAVTYRYRNLEHNLHPIIDQVITITPELEKEIADRYMEKTDG